MLLVGGFCCWWFGWFNSKPSKESSTQSVKPIDAEKRMQELITDNQAFNNVLTEIENIRYQHYPATYLDLKRKEKEKKVLIKDFKTIISHYQTKYKNLKNRKEGEKTQKETEENAAKNEIGRLVRELETLQNEKTTKEAEKTKKEDKKNAARTQKEKLEAESKYLDKFITFLGKLEYNNDICESNKVFIDHKQSFNNVLIKQLIKQLINQLQNESKDISFELFQAVNDINLKEEEIKLKEEEIKATKNNLELMAIKRNLLITQQILKQYYVELNNFLTQQNNPSQLLIHQRALSELKYYLLRAIEVTDQIERQNKLSENEKDEVKAKGKNIISFVANIIGNNSITNPKIQEETGSDLKEKLKYWQKNIVLPYKGEIKEENIEQQKLLKLIITNPKKDPNSEKSEIAFTFKETQPSTVTTSSAQPIQPENPEVNQLQFEFEKAEIILQWPSVFEEQFDNDFKTKFSELMDETRYKEFKNQIASEGGFNQLTNQSNLGYRFLALGCQTNFANDINNPHFIDLLENIFDFGWQAR
ncbi:MAG: hypothetical protein AB2N28_4150 [Candidatus Phytoplasma solani]